MDFERINPVFTTAKSTMHILAALNVPHAAEFEKQLGIEGEDNLNLTAADTDPDSLKKKTGLCNMLLRFSVSNREFVKSGYKNIFDIPCGYTSRSAIFPDAKYVGADLPPVIEDMKRFSTDNASYQVVDATNAMTLEKATEALEGPVYMTTEGLLMYFNSVEEKSFIEGMAAVLRKHGGVWVTTDFVAKQMYGLCLVSLYGRDAVEVMMQQIDKYQGKADIDMNANIVTFDDAMKMLKEAGLLIEKIPLYEESQNLDFSAFLNDEQAENIKAAASKLMVFKITADPDFVPKNEETKIQDLTISYAVSGGTLKMNLGGRLDSLSAEKFLALYDSISAVNEIKSVTLDCAGIEYLSSAGIRVLLSIFKTFGKDNFTLANPSDFVKSILSQVGLSALML